MKRMMIVALIALASGAGCVQSQGQSATVERVADSLTWVPAAMQGKVMKQGGAVYRIAGPELPTVEHGFLEEDRSGTRSTAPNQRPLGGVEATPARR